MNATITPRLRRFGNERGQSMVEFAMVLPFLMVIVLGVVEVGYALLDQHVVTKLAREGANLISRDATLAGSGNGAPQHERTPDQLRRTARR